MNELKSFNYQNKEMRALVLNNEPWWVASDVCNILNLTNPTESLKALDDDEKDTLRISEGGPERNIISEAGLYSLILRSNKPEAKTFKRWITHEVLPSIRKNGMYAKDELLDNPDLLLEVVTKLKAERDYNKMLSQKIEADKPKVAFADSVAISHSTILIGDLAKLLKQKGIDIGQNRLFEWLRQNEYLIRKHGTSFNMPTQYSMDLGLFEIKEVTINHNGGSTSISRTPKVTGKGQIYFINKFRELEDNKCK